MTRSIFALLLLAGPASAQVVSHSADAFIGRYSLDGTNPGSDSHYGGTLTLSAQGDALRAVWETGGDPVQGIGVVADGVLSVAYGGACGVVAYAPDPEEAGVYQAVWATMNGTGLGVEVARPDGDGAYRVAGTNPGSDAVYRGTMTMAAAGNATRIHWTVGASTYDGIGLTLDGVLGISYGGPSCSVAVYRMAGGTLDGVWTTPGASGIGTEIARP